MFYPLLLLGAVCAALIASILLFPKLTLGKITLSTFWIVALLGALLFLLTGQTGLVSLGKALLSDTAVNPLKILVLFLAMTALSVFLDELGFFRRLAAAAVRLAHHGQKKLFFLLYALVSVLTVFTSNDIIILSFTPFVCYFAKHAKIDPIPYLAAEFVAANTWSMALIIGNPTNIYLATSYGIGFAEYCETAIVPTLFAGAIALGALFLLFRKKLAAPMCADAEEVPPCDRFLLVFGLTILAVCTVFMAIGSYIGIEMWIVSLAALGLLVLGALGHALCKKRRPRELLSCAKRLPYSLVPFVLSMYVIVVGLGEHGVTTLLADLFGTGMPIVKYGVSSFFAANLINNIPMSELFASIIASAPAAVARKAMFATVIGSNLGAFFTPIGALAGVMWSSILQKNGLKFGYADFLRIGVCVALPALAAALFGLFLVTV